MRRCRIFLSLLLAALLLSSCDNPNNAIALGTLERDRIAHTATTAEVIVALPIAPGTRVSQGQLLVQQDTTLQIAQVARAQAELARANAHLVKLRNGARAEEVAAAKAKVTGARASLVETTLNLERVGNLVARKIESQAKLDAAQAAHDSAAANLLSAQEALRELTNGTRAEDLQMAEAELQAAAAILASEQKKLQDLAITATRAGVLDSLPWNLGERPTQGSPVAIVLAGKAPFVRAYIPEPFRVDIKIGDQYPIKVDGLAETLTGEVRWIASEPAFTPYYALNQEERSRLMYLAELQLPEQYAELPSGVPAQVLLNVKVQ
ncbi:MAG: HlyD family efflux transporter periplasmic adaptor subunit [Gammaproteobacteria bacterium]|nr:HlyD family efflux transporter periplasmic adaptor subunit [Gammaproteobacteria bacterium]NVK86919.1 HlyD family efflux transporter periplasmic adaptor subunit [Gammaproteobacteria bacterium]